MDNLAIKARTPPSSSMAGYTGVICMNPGCGEPMDVFGVWPKMVSHHDNTAVLRVIVTLECPHCERRSTYCPKDVNQFQPQSPADWR